MRKKFNVTVQIVRGGLVAATRKTTVTEPGRQWSPLGYPTIADRRARTEAYALQELGLDVTMEPGNTEYVVSLKEVI